MGQGNWRPPSRGKRFQGYAQAWMNTPACLSTFPSPFDLPNLSKHKPALLTLCSCSFWGSASGCTRTGIQPPEPVIQTKLCASPYSPTHTEAAGGGEPSTASLFPLPEVKLPPLPTHSAALSPRLPFSTGVCLFWKENNVPCGESSGGQVGSHFEQGSKGS